MRFMKLITLAIISIFAMTSVQAATFVTPSTKLSTDTSIEQIAAKKKAKKKKAKKKGKKKKAASKAGRCGTFMYWSGKKCEDTRVTPPKKK